jgi:flagellar biosynthesis protein FlhF
MKIKRYFGKTIRQAIQKVREEQGPDAVILSNRQVEGGFEIVAAIDFDEVVLDADATAGGGYAPAASAVRGPARESAEPGPNALINRRHPAGGANRRVTDAERPATTPEAVSLPEFNEMRRELKSMRGMLEQQLSGLVWGDVARRNPIQANMLRLLLKMEISPRLCREVANELRAAKDAQSAWRNALGVLAHKLPVTDDDIIQRGGVVAMLGPTGVGKTTSIAKLAARYAVRHGTRQVALITTDNYRIGAHEHLRAFARILDVPMRTAGSAVELRSALQEFSDRSLVLIDTAGMSQRDMRLNEQFAMLRQGSIRSYLVMAATTRPSGIDEIIKAYKPMALAGTILTKVDEAGSLGGLISLLIRHQLPVAYVSDGQRVPEDLYAARAHRIISRSVAMMRRETIFQSEADDSFAHAVGGQLAHA